ncbi:dephospho-CoA kinase [Thermoactinomyces intermedius]|uniref:Dephospho-CoA kinase n=2 Tax=Thermoactinomycetaceae TaxID=186824 RepID=A0A8I1ACS8_THEIN|nr:MULTISPECIES: dephospho-CoA kinase [Thermoactinomyces]MBA4548897.1 dephospho-CoA kinase [Thermoactinomyces intermedius]MBA4836850.1 dephospho-CoA kinase [Thermoactinomyces intermedius]MBH8594775.1 dephospho-CoA kinase [Thermoactinomyces intermedius]MBH8601966.1 dephospho-CoA kinase [Thermoactinomyces sp. CICC 23799]
MLMGLTGSIATGKSTVSEMFRRKGAEIIDADQIAREVVEPGTEGLARIVREFGPGILDEEGKLNRERLGARIFQNPAEREKLNRLLHPLIVDSMRAKTEKIKKEKDPDLLIWDVPLLIEGNLTQWVEAVILVYTPKEIQLERLMKRNALSKEEAEKRILAQMDIEEKKKYADYVIDNRGTLSETERQVDQLWKQLISKSG